jgi:hypothetical protein
VTLSILIGEAADGIMAGGSYDPGYRAEKSD